MTALRNILSALGVLALSYSGAAFAGPISSCALVATHIECTLYETDSLGNPTEIGDVIPLPLPVTPGFILILEPGGSIGDRATWSDELIFTASTVQLLSDGCNTGIEGDISCFVVADFATAPNAFIFEDADGFALWQPNGPGGNTYRIFSETPEPATLALLGIAIASLGLARRRKPN